MDRDAIKSRFRTELEANMANVKDCHKIAPNGGQASRPYSLYL